MSGSGEVGGQVGERVGGRVTEWMSGRYGGGELGKVCR